MAPRGDSFSSFTSFRALYRRGSSYRNAYRREGSLERRLATPWSVLQHFTRRSKCRLLGWGHEKLHSQEARSSPRHRSVLPESSAVGASQGAFEDSYERRSLEHDSRHRLFCRLHATALNRVHGGQL